MGRPVHFEVQADDIARARAFYERVFRWQSSQPFGELDYWLVSTGTDPIGIDGAIMQREAGATPGGAIHGVIITMGVADIEKARTSIVEAGGTLVTDVDTIPGVGIFCYANDTEGNRFGVIQPEMPQS